LTGRRLSQTPASGSWIWTEHGFATFEDVFKDKRANALQPFLHTLQNDWVDYKIFTHIQKQLGIPKLLQVLSTLKAMQQPGEELPSSIAGTMWQTFSQWMSADTRANQQQRLEVACFTLRYMHHEVGLWIPAPGESFHPGD
jgi:hypothetical protein